MNFSPLPLHIPDGFLTIVISAIFWAITAVTVAIAISKTNKSLGEKQVPLMGVMAAFIFAAQMLNFPVAGGTSGHFLGDRAGTVGGDPRHDLCHWRAGSSLSRRRTARHGREYF